MLEAAIQKAVWGNHHALRARELCFGALWDPLLVHPQWFSILYADRDLRRIMFRRIDLRVKFVKLLQKRINHPQLLKGPGPVRTLLMHLNKCEWSNAVTSDSLTVAHSELGTMDFFTSPDAQLKRWLSYTARQAMCEGLRARANGETCFFPQKRRSVYFWITNSLNERRKPYRI